MLASIKKNMLDVQAILSLNYSVLHIKLYLSLRNDEKIADYADHEEKKSKGTKLKILN